MFLSIKPSRLADHLKTGLEIEWLKQDGEHLKTGTEKDHYSNGSGIQMFSF
jgi:hypothetical protein